MSNAPIAIIGMACIFPQAPDLAGFWRNILAGTDAVGEPQDEWEAQRYLDSGRINTQHGGYLNDLYRFDPREFGIMPNSVDGGEPDQFLALKVAFDALQDAGYAGDGVDHRDTPASSSATALICTAARSAISRTTSSSTRPWSCSRPPSRA